MTSYSILGLNSYSKQSVALMSSTSPALAIKNPPPYIISHHTDFQILRFQKSRQNRVHDIWSGLQFFQNCCKFSIDLGQDDLQKSFLLLHVSNMSTDTRKSHHVYLLLGSLHEESCACNLSTEKNRKIGIITKSYICSF